MRDSAEGHIDPPTTLSNTTPDVTEQPKAWIFHSSIFHCLPGSVGPDVFLPSRSLRHPEDAETFPGRCVLGPPGVLLPAGHALNTSAFDAKYTELTVDIEAPNPAPEHALLIVICDSTCKLVLSVTTQSLCWAVERYLMINQEPGTTPAILLLPHQSTIFFSVSLLWILVFFFYGRDIKRTDVKARPEKIPSRESVYIFTAGILEHFVLRLYFLASQLSFFLSFIAAWHVCPPSRNLHFQTLLNPYVNSSCPVRLLVIQGGGRERYEFRCFQVFFCFFSYFRIMIHSRNFDLTSKPTLLSLKIDENGHAAF